VSAQEAASLADAYAAIEEAIDLGWRLSVDGLMSDHDISQAEDRFTAASHLLTHLADLLDGVMADDPAAIRDAAAWLAANRPDDVYER
jgi:hypothetical protein